MNRKFDLRIAAIEANNLSQQATTELYEKGMQRDANQAMNDLTKLVKKYHNEAEEQNKDGNVHTSKDYDKFMMVLINFAKKQIRLQKQ